MTRDQSAECAHAKAAEVALLLGAGWAYVKRMQDDDYPDRLMWFATVTGPDGAELHVSERDGRITWSAIYPRDNVQYEHAPRDSDGGRLSISTAVTKSPFLTAKDLSRRLIPAYLEQLVKCRASVERANGYANATVQNITALAKIMGKTPRKSGSSTENAFNFFDTNGAYGDVRASGNSVQVEIRSLTYEQAAQILHLVRGFNVKAAAA